VFFFSQLCVLWFYSTSVYCFIWCSSVSSPFGFHYYVRGQREFV